MDEAQTALPRFPDLPKLLNYPVTVGLAIEVVCIVVLLLASRRFDPTQGQLTIALLIVVAMIGLSIYSVLFSIPQDEETATIIGGLVAAFGAVVAFWVRGKNGKE